MSENKKLALFVYRCPKCDMILYHKLYHKAEKCPYCQSNLEITLISENSIIIEFNKSIDKLEREIRQLIDLIDTLTEKDREKLTESIEVLYNHLEKLMDTFPK